MLNVCTNRLLWHNRCWFYFDRFLISGVIRVPSVFVDAACLWEPYCRLVESSPEKSTQQPEPPFGGPKRGLTVDYCTFNAPNTPRGQYLWMLERTQPCHGWGYCIFERDFHRLVAVADNTETGGELPEPPRHQRANLFPLPCGRCLSVGFGSLHVPLHASLFWPFFTKAKLCFVNIFFYCGVYFNQLWLERDALHWHYCCVRADPLCRGL